MPFELSMLAAAPAVANFAVTSAQTIFDLKQVPENVRVALFTIDSTKADIREALEARVVLGKVYGTENLTEYDRSVSIVETALNDYEKAVESARLNQELNNGKLGGMTRIKWIIRDSKNAETKRDFLVQACLRMQTVTQAVRLKHDLQTGNTQYRSAPTTWNDTEAPPPAYSADVESTCKSIVERQKEDEERMATVRYTNGEIGRSSPVISANMGTSHSKTYLKPHVSVRSISVSHIDDEPAAATRTSRSHLQNDHQSRTASLSSSLDQLALSTNSNQSLNSSHHPNLSGSTLFVNSPVGARSLTPQRDSPITSPSTSSPGISPNISSIHLAEQTTRPHHRQQSQDHIPPTSQQTRTQSFAPPYPVSREPTIRIGHGQDSSPKKPSKIPRQTFPPPSQLQSQRRERILDTTRDAPPSQPQRQDHRQYQSASNGLNTTQRSFAGHTSPVDVRWAPYPCDEDRGRPSATSSGGNGGQSPASPVYVKQTYQAYRPDGRK